MKLALKRIGIVFLWLLVVLLSVILLIVTIPISFPLFMYKTFNKKEVGQGFDSLSKDFRNIAYTIDLLGNVTLFDWIDITENPHPYGEPKQPISYVIFKRKESNTLTQFDSIVMKIILLFDKNHFNPNIYKEYENH